MPNSVIGREKLCVYSRLTTNFSVKHPTSIYDWHAAGTSEVMMLQWYILSWIVVIISFLSVYDDAGVHIAKVRATTHNLRTLTYNLFLSLSSIHAPVPFLVFLLFLGVRLSASIQHLLLFWMFSDSPADLSVSLRITLASTFQSLLSDLARSSYVSTFFCSFSSTLMSVRNALFFSLSTTITSGLWCSI